MTEFQEVSFEDLMPPPIENWWTGQEPPMFYSFHPETGEYVGSGPTDPSPLEPNVWLYPGSSTCIQIPEELDGMARILNDGVWEFVTDHRGEVWWTEQGDPREVDFLGDPAEQGLSVNQPAPSSYRLFKSVFINRMTDEEAETMEGMLAAASPKLRLMFNSVEYFVSDDPLFETLLTTVGTSVGEARARELLSAI